MDRFPDSLIAFQRMFPHDDACAAWLASVRWPEGFECPRCGHDHGWALRGKAHTFECARCHRQTSVTAGTILHGSKLALTVWFWAAYLMATHSNGIAALQLQNQLGIGSYRSAWLLAAKLRKAMVDPERDPLSGLIEVDETAIWRSAPRMIPWPAAPGAATTASCSSAPSRSATATRRAACAWPRSRPTAPKASATASSATNIAAASTAKTDGWAGYAAAPVETHDPHVIGSMAAHLVLPWIHQVFSNLKGWARGVYHGLRAKHLQSYLDEFVFRFNRRRTRHVAFRSLFGIAVTPRPSACTKPFTYNMLVRPEAGDISDFQEIRASLNCRIRVPDYSQIAL